jgi:hypothetical protein
MSRGSLGSGGHKHTARVKKGNSSFWKCERHSKASRHFCSEARGSLSARLGPRSIQYDPQTRTHPFCVVCPAWREAKLAMEMEFALIPKNTLNPKGETTALGMVFS